MLSFFVETFPDFEGNLDKERGFVNGRTVTVLEMKKKGILVEMPNKQT